MENIVGRDFLPRGQGIVTRRPLLLQLIHRVGSSKRENSITNGTGPNVRKDSTDSTVNGIGTSSSGGGGGTSPPSTTNPIQNGKSIESEDHHGTSVSSGEEWGEFLHKPGVKFYDFDKIRQEIVDDTDRKTGGTKGVSPEPISLRIYSPHVPTLTMIDLPGLTKVPVGDQPKDIEKQIKEMVMKFISKSNAIVLAVTAANTDIANSDGLKLAREVDPEGIRTLGVLTKIDIMDKGTDVVEILAGRVIPLKLGYIPVVNRGQKDIDSRKSILLALDAERQFFESHHAYSSKAAFCGTPWLSKQLSKILIYHIKNTLPEIKQKIGQSLQKYQHELMVLGDYPLDANSSNQNIILSIITEFTAEFRNILDGYSGDNSLNELNGGARIAFVFYEIFSTAVNSMDPFDNVKEVDIRTLLYNSSGSTPALFVATSAFEVLIKQQIKRLEDPCQKCIHMIYDELVRILGQLLQKQTFKRFPQLKEKFYSSTLAFFRRGLDPTSKLVTQIVSAESCFINTAHPDFINGHRALAIVSEKLQLNKPSDPKKGGTGSSLGSGGTLQSPQNSSSAAYEFSSGGDSGGGIFSSFFTKRNAIKKPGILEPPPPVLKATGSVSEKEFAEIEVISKFIIFILIFRIINSILFWNCKKDYC